MAADGSASIDAGFVGRERELEQTGSALDRGARGESQVILLSGEAGIGKTRLLEELARRARLRGILVLRGRCEEDGAGDFHAPFRDAFERYVSEAAEATLRSQLGNAAGVIAQLVPRLRERLRDVGAPLALQPDEERTRLFDAISQFLIAIAARTPVALIIDDLHWADDDTLALVRHLGRHVTGHAIILLGAYRTEEGGDERLQQAFAVLQRQAGFLGIALPGLATDELEALLQNLAAARSTTWAAGSVDATLTATISADTKGNPFFVRSLVLLLEEEGRLLVEEGRWRATTPLGEISPPEGVRHVLQRRIRRLTKDTQSFLSVAAGVGRTFRFDIVTTVSKLDEDHALASVDEALGAQLIESTPALDTYAFAHALVRQTLYESLNPSRQVRLHRQIAEAIENRFGERSLEHAGDIASHYFRSRSLAGADRGVPYALRAGEDAQRQSAHGEVPKLLEIALALLPPNDYRRARIMARRGLALMWTLAFAEAGEACLRAADALADEEGDVAAADYLAEAVVVLEETGGDTSGFALATRGLQLAGSRRDETWATLMAIEVVRREVDDPTFPGIAVDTPERREVGRLLAQRNPRDAWSRHLLDRRGGGTASRFCADETASRESLLSNGASPAVLALGRYREGLRIWRDLADTSAREGRIGRALLAWCCVSRFHTALGNLAEAMDARQRAMALLERLPGPSSYGAVVPAATDELRMALDADWDQPNAAAPLEAPFHPIANLYRASFDAAAARIHARMGRAAKAIRSLTKVIPAIERAANWADNYVRLCCDAAEAVWLTGHAEHAEVIAENLRTKVIAPDFRYPMMDGRLALARLCAVQERWAEAEEWFARARVVLDEQGARPLRAITDYDEALMYHRRASDGDAQRARPLLEAALAQFRSIGMPGWICRAETLLAGGSETARAASPGQTESVAPQPAGIFVQERDFWRIAFGAREVRLKHRRGLIFLAQLLRAPGREIACTELVAQTDNGSHEAETSMSLRHGLGDAGEVLDATARAAYKRRLDELRAELAEAERFNDVGRAEGLRQEQEHLMAELARAVGLGGRLRLAGSHTERARVNVRRGLTAALQEIAAAHPVLGEHLTRTVRTGTFCSYVPDPLVPLQWHF